MAQFSGEAWLVMALVSAGGVLGMLYVLAAVVRNQTHIHDLQVKVHTLRLDYQAQLAARREAAQRGDINLSPVEGDDEVGEVDVIEEPAMKRAA